MTSRIARVLAHSCIGFALIALTDSHVDAYDLGYHGDQSTQAMAAQGFTLDGRRLVVNANMYVDIVVNIPGVPGPTLRRVHWDDRFGFIAHDGQRRWLLAKVPGTHSLDCSDRDDLYTFASVIGFVHHGIQDYYAHSNHAELNKRYATPAISPTFEEMMAPLPGFEVLAGVLRQNVPVDEGEALMSGAYFTSPPPDIDDADGNSLKLTHDNLKKDSHSTSGRYLYPRYNRTLMHSASSRMAMRDSKKILELFQRTNPNCYRRLKAYRFGRWERWKQTLKHFVAQFIGTIVGHYRSGNPTVIGDEMEVTIRPPTGYPDVEDPVRTTWSFRIKNTGPDSINEISLGASEGLRVKDPLLAPAGWVVARDGDRIKWATQGAGIPQNADVEFEVTPANGGTPGVAEVLTGSGRATQILAPVPPGYAVAMTLRAAAIIEGSDPVAMLDALDVPADQRSISVPSNPPTPITPAPPTGKRGCGCGLAPFSAGSGALVFLVVLLAAFRLRR